MSYVLPPAEPVSLAITGSTQRLPVHRVFCVGQNYARHAREMGATGREAPFFFMKPARSVVPVAEGETGLVHYPSGTRALHHEVELVVAIGAAGRGLDARDAASLVYGYAVGIDLTRRDLQSALKEQGRPWEIAKAFEESAPVGAVTPLASTGWLSAGAIRLAVNGQPKQDGNLDEMIWPVADIIAQLSQHWHLQPGDLVFTGTPEGVGAIERGDQLDATVGHLAPLRIRLA